MQTLTNLLKLAEEEGNLQESLAQEVIPFFKNNSPIRLYERRMREIISESILMSNTARDHFVTSFLMMTSLVLYFRETVLESKRD